MAYLEDIVRRAAAKCRPGQQAVAALAALQHGVVARWQLLALGLTRDWVQGRIVQGHLHPVHFGVYAVGYKRLTVRGRWMAAVLAGGPDAVLSHRAAVALWDLRPIPSGPIDVTVPGRRRRARPGIRIHNVRRLDPGDRAVVDGIPVTSPHRALLDFAEVARFQQLRLALDAADRQDLLDGRELDRVYNRSRGRRGAKPLKAAVAELKGPAPWTQSELERRFLALIREAGLPEPQANVFVEGFLVDLWWPTPRLVVEIDSYGFHKSRKKFESDRFQDTKLQLAGCVTIRVTQARVEAEPRALLRDVTRGLGRRGAGSLAAAPAARG